MAPGGYPMNTAKRSDWETKELPAKRSTIALNRGFTSEEMEPIRMGLIPEAMEDKWFIYWEDDRLFFHRSWTGFCVYVVRFAKRGDGYHMVGAEANRDPEQYRETSDERDAKMISYLVDVLLLRQEATFPSDEESHEKQALMKWSQVGRAMLDQHPGQE